LADGVENDVLLNLRIHSNRKERYAKEVTKYGGPHQRNEYGRDCSHLQDRQAMHLLREKHEQVCKKDHPDANRDSSIPWSESKVDREMSKAGFGSLGLDYELRWDSARREL
jgi:hypothetical protein